MAGQKQNIPVYATAHRGSGSHFLCVSVDLQTRSLTIKVSSIVDKKIIELCVKWSRDPGSVVTVLSPNQKILSSVFIYGKPVRNNTEILFLS